MSGLYPDSLPPLKQQFGNPNKRPTGRACPRCNRLKDKAARPGLCGACKDSRDLHKQWAAEDAAEAQAT